VADESQKPLLPAHVEPHLNIWFELDGQVVLSLWRVRLLQAIAETGSISGGARRVDIHYRRAWEKVREMEQSLGRQLLVTHVGGGKGGGAQLTPYAQELIRRFEACVADLPDAFMARVGEQFPELKPGKQP
jgi:molybdate transport system regulatory protein